MRWYKVVHHTSGAAVSSYPLLFPGTTTPFTSLHAFYPCYYPLSLSQAAVVVEAALGEAPEASGHQVRERRGRCLPTVGGRRQVL